MNYSDFDEIKRELAGELICESAPDYLRKKGQGEYTLDDYYALPEDERYELIDGYLFKMFSPTWTHQQLAGLIFHQLMTFKDKHHARCQPAISPLDVQLDKDQYTMVQPDVLILCDPDKVWKNKRLYGAPDFIVEVLSPSTRKKDISLKLFKYRNAGVREYWILDPENQTVTVHDIEHNSIPKIYRFDEDIPVMIWGGACKINLSHTISD